MLCWSSDSRALVLAVCYIHTAKLSWFHNLYYHLSRAYLVVGTLRWTCASYLVLYYTIALEVMGGILLSLSVLRLQNICLHLSVHLLLSTIKLIQVGKCDIVP
jgi:hypothetical protein